jgi:hypothetical protein
MTVLRWDILHSPLEWRISLRRPSRPTGAVAELHQTKKEPRMNRRFLLGLAILAGIVPVVIPQRDPMTPLIAALVQVAREVAPTLGT